MDSDRELSVLERVLAREGDTKVASILALDLFIVGVDTVNILQLNIFPLNAHEGHRVELFADLDRGGLGALPVSVTPGETGFGVR